MPSSHTNPLISSLRIVAIAVQLTLAGRAHTQLPWEAKQEGSSHPRTLSLALVSKCITQIPIFLLVQSFGISLSELTLIRQSEDSSTQTNHRMHIRILHTAQIGFVLRIQSPLRQFLRQFPYLLLSRNFSREQQPEHRLWKHLRASLPCRQFLLTLRNCHPVKTDPLGGIEHGPFPQHSLQSTHSTHARFNRDFPK